MNSDKDLNVMLKWALWRKQCEVDNRPDVNIHKDAIEQTWNQVIQQIENMLMSKQMMRERYDEWL